MFQWWTFLVVDISIRSILAVHINGRYFSGGHISSEHLSGCLCSKSILSSKFGDRMSFSCLDSKFFKFLAGIFSTYLLPSWEFVIWWRYWWVSDFQCVISSSIIYTTFFLYKLFLLNFDNFYEHVMGNDVRKWIPNQKHTKWPHKHHNLSIKLIQKSTRIHVYNFLKEKYQFCWSNALSKQTWWKTL